MDALDALDDRPVTKVTLAYVGCDISLSRLRRIIRVIADSADGARLTFETERNGTTLSGRSTEQLLTAVHESPEPGPDDIDNLEIRMVGTTRKITLGVRASSVTSSVEGDNSWARGVTEQIRALLVEAGGRTQASSSGLLYAAGIVSFLAALVGALLAFRVIPRTGLGLLLGGIIVVVGGLAAYVTGRIRRRRDRCRLSATGELPSRRWWHGAGPGDRIAFGILIVGVLTLIVHVIKLW